MAYGELIYKLMFEWEEMNTSEIENVCKNLSKKLLRWLGANHPDNRTRKIFFVKSGVSIDDDTVINRNFVVSDDNKPLLRIGKRVAISPNVTVICASGPNNSRLNDNKYVSDHLICSKEVIIKDDVWIGTNAVIMPGVEIGEGSVIGAGAVVTRNVDPFSIVAGIPARKIRDINSE